MTDIKELRERLSWLLSSPTEHPTATQSALRDAKAAIERLEAEVTLVRKQRDEAWGANAEARLDRRRALTRCSVAEAQRDQLAEALRIAEAVLRNHPTPFSTTDGGAITLTSASEAAERARAALDHVEGVE